MLWFCFNPELYIQRQRQVPQNNSKILAAHELEIVVGCLQICVFHGSEQKALGLVLSLHSLGFPPTSEHLCRIKNFKTGPGIATIPVCFHSTVLTLTSLEGVSGPMCVKDQIIEAEKDAVHESGESRVFGSQNFKGKNTWANCLPLGAIFLAHLIKVYASLTAFSRHQLS